MNSCTLFLTLQPEAMETDQDKEKEEEKKETEVKEEKMEEEEEEKQKTEDGEQKEVRIILPYYHSSRLLNNVVSFWFKQFNFCLVSCLTLNLQNKTITRPVEGEAVIWKPGLSFEARVTARA